MGWTRVIEVPLLPPPTLEGHSTQCLHSESCSKNAALREEGVAETIWTGYMTEPH